MPNLVSDQTNSRRQIRSFVRREGRATPAQKKAMHGLWPKYGFTPDAKLDFATIFGRAAPIVFEIGFGDGEALVDAAKQQADRNFVGAEVYTPGVGHCLLRLEQENLSNVRLCQQDAIEILNNHIPDNALSEIRLFFPDPWPKKKHHKRRIVNADFATLISQKLQLGGRIHFATDWAPYAAWAMDIFEANEMLENSAGQRQFTPKLESRITTKFERRGQRLGHESWDLVYKTIKV
jgi:tRNA (guanine-N7-)-methyltransferase